MIGVAWVSGISYINSRHTTLDVRVSPAVEQVQFFAETEPNAPVAQIVTHGLDTQAAVELPNAAQHSLWTQSRPAQYFFVTTAGSESYRSPRVCCQTGLLSRHELLIIRDLRDWEKIHAVI
jgi:hypothetical protein